MKSFQYFFGNIFGVAIVIFIIVIIINSIVTYRKIENVPDSLKASWLHAAHVAYNTACHCNEFKD